MLQPCPDVLQQTSDAAFGGEDAWQLSSDLLELSFFCFFCLFNLNMYKARMIP